MLDNVLRAPLQFFDVTPVGRLLARFSKDVDVLDSSLSWAISNSLSGIFEVNLLLFYYSSVIFIFRI